MDASIRNRHKQEIALSIALDPKFKMLKTNLQRDAYIQILVNTGKIMELAKTEISSVASMAQVMLMTDGEDVGDIGTDTTCE